MKRVYFYDTKNIKRFLGLGQIVSLFQSCYFKGKELGYDEIFFEWHNLVTYPNWDNEGNFKGLICCPKETILPIKFIQKGTRLRGKIDTIDISEPNILYDGCPPILSNPMNQSPHLNYLNKYFLTYGKSPSFEIPKDKDIEKYILFHYRESNQDRQLERNTPVNEWIKTFNILKETYNNIKFIKIGEPSPIDSKFDIVLDYLQNNIGELFKVINNSSLFVCSPSGPLQISYMLNSSTIVFPNNAFYNTLTKWNEKYGTSAYDWVKKDRYLYFRIEDYNNINKDTIINFIIKNKIL